MLTVALTVAPVPGLVIDAVGGVVSPAVPGTSVNDPDLLPLPNVPVTVTPVFCVTADVVIVNVADVWPAGTVTIGGACAIELLVAIVIDAPPEGAAPVSVTVAVTLLPPVALVTPGVTDASCGPALGSGKMSRNTSLVLEPELPVMVAEVKLPTALVPTVKVVALLPAAIFTLAGTCAAGLSLESEIVAPPGGAGVTSPTTPRTEPPAVVEVGLMPNASSDGIAGTSGSTRRTAPCSPLSLLPYDA